MSERQEELVQLLQDVNRGIVERFKGVLEKHGLPLASMPVLREVRNDPGITSSEIARRTGMAKSQVSTTIDLLVEQGLAEKLPDPADQRLIRVHITEPAQQHIGQIKSELRHQLSLVMAALPDEQIDVVTQSLRTLKAILDADRGSQA